MVAIVPTADGDRSTSFLASLADNRREPGVHWILGEEA